MDFKQILQLIDHVSASRFTAFYYEEGEQKLSIECGCMESAAAPDEAAYPLCGGSSPAESETTGIQKEVEGSVVKSPLVGTFYSAPSEDAKPFVQVGDRVKKGQILAIVEAMKLMNEIESDFDGEIAEIYVKNGEAVEYGMPLFRIV